MPCIVDASTALAMVLPDESGLGDKLIESILSKGIRAPGHWPFEVANGCVVASRRGRLTAGEMRAALADLQALPVTLDTSAPLSSGSRIVDAAVEHGLTVYDAAYLELALRTRFPIATLDKQLRSAAVAAGCALL